MFGGYKISENFAVEGCAATSDIEENFSGSDPFLGNVSLNIKGDYEVLTVRALWIIPLSSVSLFGGVGFYDATLNATGRFEDDFQIFTVSVDDSDSGATVVGGVELNFERVGIRAEYEWFDTDSSVDAALNAGLFSGLFYRF